MSLKHRNDQQQIYPLSSPHSISSFTNRSSTLPSPTSQNRNFDATSNISQSMMANRNFAPNYSPRQSNSLPSPQPTRPVSQLSSHSISPRPNVPSSCALSKSQQPLSFEAIEPNQSSFSDPFPLSPSFGQSNNQMQLPSDIANQDFKPLDILNTNTSSVNEQNEPRTFSQSVTNEESYSNVPNLQVPDFDSNLDNDSDSSLIN